jgi:Lactonase, 7-bladed beta-propeller
MSKRFAWLLGVGVLVLIAFLIACGSSYNSSTDGLVVVGSQGSAVLETFSFDLNSGHISPIANSPNDTANDTCLLNGLPSAIVVDPAGAYAYTIVTASTLCPGSKTGIQAFKLNSDGTIAASGGLVPHPFASALFMDAAGKFLFVLGEGIGVYGIGSGATLTAVSSNFTFTLPAGFQPANFVALAATPTVFPSPGINGVTNAVCSNGMVPPKAEYLYVADSVNNVVWEFSVNTSSGALGNPPTTTTVPYFATDQVPMGVAVDPCDRFVYVSDNLTNKVSAYTICNGTVTASTSCTALAPGALVEISGSPFSLAGGANGPGPLVVDPFGNNVYVLDTLSNTISPFKISPVSGSLSTFSTITVATGNRPTSIAIRGDDSWLFVTNFNAATVSQYSVTPATGDLSVLPVIQTDNYPFGVAVK